MDLGVEFSIETILNIICFTLGIGTFYMLVLNTHWPYSLVSALSAMISAVG